jgi:choline dehydrogenase
MTTDDEADYVVVGSGAGGGTLAARLAEAGHRVLLLEAGGDPRALRDERLPDDYDVPAFHAFAAENEAMRWDFFVRHYADETQSRRDSKFVAARDGVLYPRAGTLGGCTAHNAMILVAPANATWEEIAGLTGDESWRAERMRGYFQRIEDCRHRWPWRLANKLGFDPTRHGWAGWLTTEKAIPRSAFDDIGLMRTIIASGLAAMAAGGGFLRHLSWLIESFADPNDWRVLEANAEGVFYTPLTTRGHRRMGARERLLAVARRHPDRLHIELDALATRVLFDEGNRAIGVEYLKGARLYRAHARPSEAPGERRRIAARREVILAGGAFNSPQLLMLSGIGPSAAIARHGIAPRIDLPGVGRNLQDRYEVGVVCRMTADWQALTGARFAHGDPLYRQWADTRSGLYTTNGAGLAVIRRSAPGRALPDLFCMAFLGLFKGYFPGYSRLLAEHLDYLSWTVLKAHTRNRAGEVSLRSADPRDPPAVNFRYFEEGDDAEGEDLDSVVAGIRFVRRTTERLKQDGLIAEEELPGAHVQSDEALKDYVRANAWGHHASCSCAIGPRAAGGVIDGDFRVHGTEALRVVDASVFPRIPGFFIASAVYMIAETAADTIRADAAGPAARAAAARRPAAQLA